MAHHGADPTTNNHAIRVIDLENETVSTVIFLT